MAGRFFEGFEYGNTSSGGDTSVLNTTNWSCLHSQIPHPAIFGYNDVVAQTRAGRFASGGAGSDTDDLSNVRNYVSVTPSWTSGLIFGAQSLSVIGGGYGAATTHTRTEFNTNFGHSLGIVLDKLNPAVTEDELWFYISGTFGNLGNLTFTSADQPTSGWTQMFKWGDIEIRPKSAAPTATDIYTAVFAVRNNGVEVATVTVPNLYCGSLKETAVPANPRTRFFHCYIRVKLHATTGTVECYINGNAMSVTYANQNTVVSTSRAAANAVFIAPPAFDNGATIYTGCLDNLYIDDAEFPSGVPYWTNFVLAAQSSASDVSVTGGTTLTALTGQQSDGNQLRFNSTTARIDYTATAPSTTAADTNILAFVLTARRASNRYLLGDRRIAQGIRLSGVDYEDEYLKDTVLPISITTAPASNGIMLEGAVFNKGAGVPFTISELASITRYYRTHLP